MIVKFRAFQGNIQTNIKPCLLIIFQLKWFTVSPNVPKTRLEIASSAIPRPFKHWTRS
jgi:hypothetical protein